MDMRRLVVGAAEAAKAALERRSRAFQPLRSRLPPRLQ